MIEICGQTIKKNSRADVELISSSLYDDTSIGIGVKVVCGTKPGPVLFVTAAIHGDEINGVEIIRRLLLNKRLKSMSGVLIAIPVLNAYGFNTRSRYLPDRRDLNRCFPGSEKGSLAGRIADAFRSEILEKSTHGIDLHTAAVYRTNLPQIRACLDSEEVKRLALSFGAPVILNADIRDGSLRQAALDQGIPMLVYEAGEALRFSEPAIRQGVKGVLAVMTEIGMLKTKTVPVKKTSTYQARSSYWVRAPSSGMLQSMKKLGDHVAKDERISSIMTPMGQCRADVVVPREGVIIGETTLPLVNEGDALYHVATFADAGSVAGEVEQALDSDLI